MRIKNTKAFTLIEVLVALAIFAGGIMVVSQSWSGNLLRVRKTHLYNNVALLLERKLIEIEALYKDKSLSEIPDEDAGDFGSDFKQYTWKMEAQEFEMPDLSSALIGRDGGADENMLMIMNQMKEFISKSVKEVKVTIFIKTPLRTIEYSASTYFVDYTQSLALGGGAASGGGESN